MMTEKKGDNLIATGLLFLLGLLILFGLGMSNMMESDRRNNPYSSEYESTSTYYDIYYVDAPFGLLWVEETAKGRMSGFFLFGVGAMSGRYSSTMEISEAYTTKYFDGNELKTKIFDATAISIIVDGTFQLERVRDYWRTYNYYGDLNGEGYTDIKAWKIHIPFLPKLNETISMEWSYIGS